MAQIKVLITDNTGGNEQVSVSGGGSANGVNNTIGSNNDSNVADNKKSSKMLAAATMIGSQALNYTTSNIGKWTGDSRMQRNINNANQVIALGMMAYANPYVAIAVAAVNMGTTALDESYERKWDTRRSNLAKARVGELKGRGH
jgi:hypothetical protein